MSVMRIIVFAVSLVIVLVTFLSCSGKPARAPSPSRSYFKDSDSSTAEDVIALYRDLGYDTFAEALQCKALPCIRLIPDASAGRPLCSRIGGLPDLPDPSLWPQYEGKSMAFIAQLNLDELPKEAQMGSLPTTGILYFFYDAEQSTWGFDPKDEGSWAVIYRDLAPATTTPAQYPDDLPEQGRYKSVPVRLETGMSIPDPGDILADFSLSEKQEDEVFDVYGQFTENSGPHHQLLGHPAPIQGDMQLECQLVSRGLYCGDSTGYNAPRAEGLQAGASQWRLLLQVDTHEEAGMMWGDCGRLYFWMSEDDLRNKRFEKAWMILQCY